MKLSIIIPAFNEINTIEEIVSRVENVKLPLEKEIIVVDDASSDGTRELLKNRIERKVHKVIYHEKNMGKGAALRSGFKVATGDIILIQDADLEYYPDEYPQLIGPVLDDKADVVFGSRFIGAHRCFLFTHYVGNRIVNLLANIFFNTVLSDFMTCYKAFKAEVIKNIYLQSNRFGIEAEITGLVFRMGYRIYEVPISYSGRDYSEGKKIKWTDFFVTIWYLIFAKLKPLTDPKIRSRHAGRKD